MSVGFYVEAHLTAVKIDGTGCKALCSQNLGHAVESDERLGEVFGRLGLFTVRCRHWCTIAWGIVIFLTCFMMILQNLLYLFVGKASVAASDCMRQFPMLHFSFLVDVENDRIGQFVFIGPK